MRIPALVVACLLVSTLSTAQTVALSVDLASVDAVTADPVDDDGNPDTLAWLLTRTQTFTGALIHARRQLVVLMPNGAMCFEDPFYPSGEPLPSVDIAIERSGRRDVLIVRRVVNYFGRDRPHTEILLDRRRCR